ncbi:hypothetical protein AL387_gp036 [Salmon gill poxvirus]|uniref:Uncharacterized protein n=1 Tax=Salmon gill poxvirus TaxID=1680908 RepID=A0A0H4Y0Y3_9POXV|nr:hypothetical protein AL387_gp036 [Salmon gill poxvirus]AKR04160.1 hypothetical protein SGPV036 [Salmon gill poxvirus]
MDEYISINFMNVFDSIHSMLSTQNTTEDVVDINTEHPDLLYYGTPSKINTVLTVNHFLSKSFLSNFLHDTGAWKTVGNKPLIPSTLESLQDQITSSLFTVYCETKKSQYDYLLEFTEEMMSSDNINVKIFACWLRTHPNMTEILNILFTEIFYIVNTADTKTGKLIDLNISRPNRSKFNYLPLPETYAILNKDRLLSRYFLYYWNNISIEILMKIWNEFLQQNEEKNNPFIILMKEMKLVFGSGLVDLTKKTILSELTFSKTYFAYYVLTLYNISKTDEKVRSKIFDIWR